MLLTKQQLDSGGVQVAGGGTTALSIIGTALGGLAVLKEASEGGRGFLGGLFGGRGRECGEGDVNGRYGKGYSRVAHLEDELFSLKDRIYTNEKVEGLEEKVEKMLMPIYAQLKCLEVGAAVDKAVEAQKEKDRIVIEKLKDYIDRLEDEKYVKKISAAPCGYKLVPCCDATSTTTA